MSASDAPPPEGKHDARRRSVNPIRDQWLDHLRAWLEGKDPRGGTRYEWLNVPMLERTADLRVGSISRWWNRNTAGRNQSAEVRLTHDQCLRLFPLLKLYGYTPPESFEAIAR